MQSTSRGPRRLLPSLSRRQLAAQHLAALHLGSESSGFAGASLFRDYPAPLNGHGSSFFSVTEQSIRTLQTFPKQGNPACISHCRTNISPNKKEATCLTRNQSFLYMAAS
jgi:hypothetical protein